MVKIGNVQQLHPSIGSAHQQVTSVAHSAGGQLTVRCQLLEHGNEHQIREGSKRWHDVWGEENKPGESGEKSKVVVGAAAAAQCLVKRR